MASSALRVSIVAPTFNESRNVAAFVSRIDKAMGETSWEVIFVDDDSEDGTWHYAKKLSERDSRVRCLRRIDRRGLAGACIEGVLSSSANFIVIVDADLQHDEAIIPEMLTHLEADTADLVIGTRIVKPETEDAGFSKQRVRASQIATRLATAFLGTKVTDPMSGFFAMRRESFENIAPRLSTSGFKILLDILASSWPPLRVQEVGFHFRSRNDGESKFDMRAMLDFGSLLVNKATGGMVPARFVLFGLVGGLGVFVHLAALRFSFGTGEVTFTEAQAIATCIAMTSNFFINNMLTYRDMKLRGVAAMTGLVKYFLLCGLGSIANVGMASWLFGVNGSWWLAGTAGVIVGSVFNYSMSSAFVWRRKPRQTFVPSAAIASLEHVAN